MRKRVNDLLLSLECSWKSCFYTTKSAIKAISQVNLVELEK